MGSRAEKLLSVGSAPLCAGHPQLTLDPRKYASELSSELETLLGRKNGFYAFESALHVFGAASDCTDYDLEAWNSDELWRGCYGDLTKGFLFFAQDVFGEQFAFRGEAVWRFDPDTAHARQIAQTLEGWAGLIVANYEVETGWPLAHEWQRLHGPLPARHRLIPGTPFVLGGEYKLDNLKLMEAARGMRLRAHVARQVHGLPDGTKVQVRIVDTGI